MPLTRMILLAAIVVLAHGCMTQGTGAGLLVTGGRARSTSNVSFAWRASPDATRGTITAALPDGRVFTGDFRQVTANATQDVPVQPWSDSWNGTGFDSGVSMYSRSAYVRRYSGHVIAELQGPNHQRMRCDFVLSRPENGPAAGGMGQCELSNGERIDYATLGE
jgi:hypothetical protein